MKISVVDVSIILLKPLDFAVSILTSVAFGFSVVIKDLSYKNFENLFGN